MGVNGGLGHGCCIVSMGEAFAPQEVIGARE